MTRAAVCGMMALLCGWAGMGCDRPAPPPPKLTAPPPAATQEVRPTTQELLSGPYKRIALPGMPLSVQVPESWKIEIGKDYPATFLAGPSPSGQARIQLSKPDSFTFKQEQIDAIVAKAKKEMADNPKDYRKVESRMVGRMLVIEKLWITESSSPQVDAQGAVIYDDKGKPLTLTLRPAHWTLTAFIPNADAFSRFELSLIDKLEEEFVQDERLLARIYNSLSEDVGSAASPATAPQ